MKRLTLLLLVTALVLSCSRNTPPLIESLIAEPDSVYPGDTVTITYKTSDADGDAILYLFGKSSGSWILNIGTGQPRQWIAPKEPGDYYLTLIISDLTDKVSDSVRIVVMDSAGVFIDARDGHSYQWVRIGKQTWMAENLAYIPEVSPSSVYSDYRKQFYVNGFEGSDLVTAKASDNYKAFGVLYNDPASKDACPTGWQMPDTVNWKTLTHYLGNDAAGDLKSITGWKNDYWGVDGNGNNSSGFNAFPGGCYFYTYGHGGYGAFNPPGETSEFHSQNGRTFSLLRLNSYFRIGSSKKEDGYSVRCIKKNS